MASTLKVATEAMLATGDVMADASAGVARAGVASHFAEASGGLSGLTVATALQSAGTRVDETCNEVGHQLETFATGLRSAAEKYRQTDAESGDGINQVAP